MKEAKGISESMRQRIAERDAKFPWLVGLSEGPGNALLASGFISKESVKQAVLTGKIRTIGPKNLPGVGSKGMADILNWLGFGMAATTADVRGRCAAHIRAKSTEAHGRVLPEHDEAARWLEEWNA